MAYIIFVTICFIVMFTLSYIIPKRLRRNFEEKVLQNTINFISIEADKYPDLKERKALGEGHALLDDAVGKIGEDLYLKVIENAERTNILTEKEKNILDRTKRFYSIERPILNELQGLQNNVFIYNILKKVFNRTWNGVFSSKRQLWTEPKDVSIYLVSELIIQVPSNQFGKIYILHQINV